MATGLVDAVIRLLTNRGRPISGTNPKVAADKTAEKPKDVLPPPPVQDTTEQSNVALRVLAQALLGGLVLTVLFSASSANLASFAAAAGVGLVVAAASGMAGGLLGFLFGIPRSLQAADTARSQGASATGAYGSNTNLEQISDWLTKILVGVGLTQLNEVPGLLGSIGTFLAPAFPGTTRPDVFTPALVLYFLIGGFLFGYLWTRLFMRGLLGAADTAADTAAQRIQLAAVQQQQLQQLEQIDVTALRLVGQQIEGAGSTQASEKDLRDAILKASPVARAWVRTKAGMSPTPRAIPVLRALAEADDATDLDHMQLGTALMNRNASDADLTRAAEAWDSAIRIRQWDQPFYELNRAICRIRLDKEKSGASPEVARILPDLKTAASDPVLLETIERSPEIQKWLTGNGFATKDVTGPQI